MLLVVRIAPICFGEGDEESSRWLHALRTGGELALSLRRPLVCDNLREKRTWVPDVKCPATCSLVSSVCLGGGMGCGWTPPLFFFSCLIGLPFSV